MDQDSKLRLEDAKWIAQELGKLDRKDQSKVFRAKGPEGLVSIFGNDSNRYWRALESWRIESSLGNHIDIPSPRTAHVEKTDESRSESILSPAKTTAGAAALVSYFAFDRIRNREYYKFKKEREAYVKEQIEKWNKNPDESFAKSETGARNRAINEFHDKKLLEEPEKFQKWAKKHKDPDMERAIKRKEILEKENPRRDQKELDKYLKEEEIKYPDKTHREEGDISQDEATKRLERAFQKAEQKETPESVSDKLKLQQDKAGEGVMTADQRIEKAARIGMAELATPAAAATYLESISNKSNQPNTDTEEATNYDELPPESAQVNPSASENTDEEGAIEEKVARIEDDIKRFYREQEEINEPQESSAVPQYTKPKLQPPGQGSSFSVPQRERLGGLPWKYRRAQRARRRYGPGGVSKGVGKKVAKKGASTLGRAILSNPYVLAIIIAIVGIIVAFFILISIIRYGCDLLNDPVKSGQSFINDQAGTVVLLALGFLGRSIGMCETPYQIQIPENPPGVITEKTGPPTIENGGDITYTIKITYDPSVPNAISFAEFNSLSLYDVPLYDFAFLEATGNFERSTADDGTKYFNWIFANQDASSVSFEFQLTLSPNDGDIRAINAIYVSGSYIPIEYTAENPQEGPSVSTGSEPQVCGSRAENDIWRGADCLPTNDKCGGRYQKIDETIDWLSNFPNEDPAGNGGNFGDPLCTYRLAKAERIVEELESNSSRANFWKDIVACEGGVNSYGRQVHPDTGRPNGPAGMFQMNIGRPIFSRWSPNGSLLRGDIPWQRQIQNAIGYNNNLRAVNNDFGFWGSAMCLCWWPEYRTKGYCQDILRKGVRSDEGPRAPATNCPEGPQYLSCETAVKCTNDRCINLGRSGPRD
jgi:hypothetical protein